MTLQRAILALLIPALLGIGPCGPIPGWQLSGQVVNEPTPNWTALVDSVKYCQVEVRPADPYSFTAACFVVDGVLHVGSMGAPKKSWPGMVANDADVRVRFEKNIYLRRAIKLTDPADRRKAFQAKMHSSGKTPNEDPPEDFWFYRLDPRPPA